MELLSKLLNYKRVNSNRENCELSVIEKSEVKDNTDSESSLVNENSTSIDGNGELVHWSPSLQSLLDEPPSNLPQQLVFGGMIFSLAIIIWAWFGQVEEIGKARGKLVPNGETYKVEPVEMGKISRIEVDEGERVQAGQILVELNDELVAKEFQRLEQMLAAYQIELSQKRALLERVCSQAQTDAKIAEAEALGYRSSLALAKEKVAISRQLLGSVDTINATKLKPKQIRQIPNNIRQFCQNG
ncbi:hypothetical protein [Myxosarcina sp. GI1(2024)]